MIRVAFIRFDTPRNGAATSTQSGVVEFSTPVMPESTVVSPTAKSRNGNALWKNAATSRWPQVLRCDGRLRRPIRHSASSTTAPSTSRASTSCTGESASSPSLIQKKLDPHINASAAILSSVFVSPTPGSSFASLASFAAARCKDKRK